MRARIASGGQRQWRVVAALRLRQQPKIAPQRALDPTSSLEPRLLRMPVGRCRALPACSVECMVAVDAVVRAARACDAKWALKMQHTSFITPMTNNPQIHSEQLRSLQQSWTSLSSPQSS